MIPMLNRAFAAVLASLLIASTAFASGQDIAYGPDPAQRLDVCTPPVMRGAAPALLMIHGGGWHEGSRLALRRECEAFAEAGIVAIPVDYRLATGAAGTTWPAQFNDVQLAMRWVRDHARLYGIDPSHICAEGDSAGGQLALLLGVVNTIDPGDMQTELSGVSPHANCAVAISGAADLARLAIVHPAMVSRLVGQGDAQGVREREISGSPALRVQNGAAPSLMIHGLDDPWVPFAQAVTMQAALARAGVNAWLVSHQGGHEFKGMTAQQGTEAWLLIQHFTRSMHLAGPPGQVSLEQAIGRGL